MRARSAGGQWWLLTLLVLPIAAYGLRYAMLGEAAYVPNLAPSFRDRAGGVFVHTLFGSIVLLAGLAQFHTPLRLARPRVHRLLGRVYVVGALAGGGAGTYLAAHSYGGWTTHLGFGLLGVGVLVTTTLAWRHAVNRRFAVHRRWMVRSYALFFAAVMLRIWLPLLATAFGGFDPAYKAVAWACWVPNVLWAEWYLRRRRSRETERELAPALAHEPAAG